MKNIFLVIMVLEGMNIFAQEIPNRLENLNKPVYVFEFNEKVDEVIYKKIQGITMITDFEILINKKKVSFNSPLMDRNKKLKVNVTRIKLEEIIKKDTIDKQPYFYIKEEDKYYPADYIMFRTIRD